MEQTQKGWRERLKEEFWNEDIDSEHGGEGYVDWGGKKLPAFIEELLAAQETAFKERVRELVPEKLTELPLEWEKDMPTHNGLIAGYNACRQEVITRIERLYEIQA